MLRLLLQDVLVQPYSELPVQQVDVVQHKAKHLVLYKVHIASLVVVLDLVPSQALVHWVPQSLHKQFEPLSEEID
jgi:hypothetical protein